MADGDVRVPAGEPEAGVEDVTATHATAAATHVSAEDLLLYKECKDELADTLKKEGNVYFTDRGPYAGMLNQGATCYMNSLLQTLFHTPRFRKRLYEWRYKPDRDGESEFCIPLALQKLFARLQAGAKAAYSTKELTHSFRWTDSRAFQQHDVQEFFTKLFTALEDATEGYSMVDDLYQGEMIDYLSCQSCEYQRRKCEVFRELELEISSPTVVQSLNTYQGQELLCGDNQWFCSQCDAKVDAAKGVQLKTLPPVFTLHLKRFAFDFNLMRRVKLSDRFFLQPRMRASEFLRPEVAVDGDSGEQSGEAVADQEYELFAIMIHQGTARGGHYFAYIKPSGSDDWFEFNDVNVKRLEPAEVQEGFDLAQKAHDLAHRSTPVADAAANDGPAPPTAPSGGETAPKSVTTPPAMPDRSAPVGTVDKEGPASDKTAESSCKKEEAAAGDDCTISQVAHNMCTNAYLIMYREVNGEDATVPMPTFLQAMADAENSRFERMQRVFRIRQAIVALDVYTLDNAKVSLDVPTSMTLREVTAMAYDAVFSESKGVEDGEAPSDASGVDSTQPPLELCRLRRFVPQTSRPTETFEGREDKPLHEIGLVNAATLLLESRKEDEEFDAFNPNEMVARLLRWDDEAGCIKYDEGAMIKVEGDQEATVGQLKAAVEAAVGVPAASQRLVAMDERRAVVMTLEADDAQIRRTFGFRSGEDVVLEVLKAGEAMGAESATVRQFDLERNVITICFNKPDTPDEIDQVVPSNRNHTLATLKASIAEALGLDVDDFHLRRSATAPQFKDETATLRDLDLVDQSMVFVAMGAPMAPDQFGLEVYIYRPDDTKAPFKHIISNFPASETQSMGSLKRRITEHTEVNHPPSKLRLRERSNREAGKIFRDTQSVRGAIRNLKDGHRICVQLLDFVERTTRADMVISLCIWKPLLRQIRRSDVVVKRKSTVGELWELLHSRFGVGVDDPTVGYPPPPADEEDEDGAGAGVGEAKAQPPPLLASQRTAAPAPAPAPTPPVPATEGGAVGAPADPEARAVAAALAANPSGIGLVKMPTYPKLTLASVWKYKWNSPQLLPWQGLTTCGFRDGTTFVVRDEKEFALAKCRRKKKPTSGGGKPTGAGRRSGRPKRWAPPAGRSPFAGHENVLTIGGDGGATRTPPAGGAESDAPDWACTACTFANSGGRGSCEMCGASAP